MSGRRNVIKNSGEEGFELQFGEASTWGELFKTGLRSSALYAGIAFAAACLLLVAGGLSNVPKHLSYTLPDWKYFWDGVTSVFPLVLKLSLSVIAVVTVVTFVATVWNRRRLATRYRVEIEDGELRVVEIGAFGEHSETLDATDKGLKFQKNRLTDSTLETSLADQASHEITMITEEEMYTFGEGIDERAADRAVEQLERKVTGSDEGHDPSSV